MTIFGPDISSYEAGLVLSRLADASFVIAKTTEGTYYTDADYQGWRQQAAQLGKPFVWYHFLSGESAAAQAAHTAANVGASGLPGMLDCEPEGSFKPTLAQIIAYAKAAHAAALNLRLVYLPRWYWQQIGSPDLSELAALGVHLVSSAYPGGGGSAPELYPGDGAAGWASYGGMTPLLYQFTNQASDGGQLDDYNAYRGTVAELQQLLEGDTPMTPQEIQTLVDDVVNGVLAKLPAATAQATYRYGEESVTVTGVDGKPQVLTNVPLGHLAHGAWDALNNPAGAVPQMRGQVNDLFHRAAFDPAAFVTAVTPVIEQAVKSGLPADRIAEAIARAVPDHLTLTVGVK